MKKLVYGLMVVVCGSLLAQDRAMDLARQTFHSGNRTDDHRHDVPYKLSLNV